MVEQGMCEACESALAVWFADNNADKMTRAYCEECEEARAMRYGCAMFIKEGAMCTDGACGCNGTGLLEVV